MKKRTLSVLASLILILLLAGCSTLVGISTLVPSEVNLTGYKTVAVASVKPYNYLYSTRGSAAPEIRFDTSVIPLPAELSRLIYYFSWDIPYQDTADYITGVVEDALNQGIYTIVKSTTTDRIINRTARGCTVRQSLLDNGIDALVTGEVTEQKYKTYITAEVSTDPVTHAVTYYYYLNRSGSLRYTYTVQDVETLAVLDTYSFSGSTPEFYESERVLIGVQYPDGTFDYSSSFTNSTLDFKAKFRSIADSFGSTIKKRLTPYYTRSNLFLQSNKAKDPQLDVAFGYADNGMYQAALEIFLSHWNSYGDYVSGYNASVLLFGTGRSEQAISLADTVFRRTGEKDALRLCQKLTTMYQNNKAAEQQINGDKGSAGVTADVIL